ncbi:MAG: DMT family transporter [Verrucomicrobia bacterium]|nr:DMT family transporter [Verrucomicrobiota bacterium]
MPTEETPPRLSLGIGITIFANLFFATASALVWSFSGKFPTIQIVFIQNIVSLLCILPIALRKGPARIKTSVFPIHLLRDVMGVTSYFLYFLAIRFLNLVDASTLYYMAPFFIPMIWWVWMKEKIPANVWWSIVVGFIGVAIILNPSKEIFQLGFVFGLFSGLASAIALCAVRVLNLKKEPMSRTLFYYFSIGSVLTFPFAWASWVSPVGIEWFYCISIGVSIALGQVLLTIAYRYGTASYLSPLGYTTLIYAILISWLLFEKPPSLRSLIGAIIIIVGGTITYILKKKPETIAQTFESPQPKERPPL